MSVKGEKYGERELKSVGGLRVVIFLFGGGHVWAENRFNPSRVGFSPRKNNNPMEGRGPLAGRLHKSMSWLVQQASKKKMYLARKSPPRGRTQELSEIYATDKPFEPCLPTHDIFSVDPC